MQALSGVALLLDAGLNSIEEGRRDEAQQIIGRALERHRATIGQLRSLSFNLEPVVLRDQGFGPAVRALTDQIELVHHVQVDLDVDAAEHLAEQTQAALYQIIREAINQAVRRGPPEMLAVTVRQSDDGALETSISDDAPGERRRRSLEELEERARTLNGDLVVDQRPTGGPRPAAPVRNRSLRSRPMNGKYLLFVWKPSGYELREIDGEVPAVGAEVEQDGQKLRVTKVAPSPLPGDSRLCAYLQAA